MNSVFVVEVPVIANCIKILSASQQCFYDRFMSLEKIKRMKVSM